MKTRFTEKVLGRLVLHLACAVRDHHWRWHWAGVLREVPCCSRRKLRAPPPILH